MGIGNRLSHLYPSLKKELRMAKVNQTPSQFLDKAAKAAALYGFMFTILFFFIIDKAQLPKILLLPVFFVLLVALFRYSFLGLRARITKREREINKEVLFIGRYLLVKLYSGRPLLNALIETANSRGIASKYIKEIVDDIDTGSTIEEALNNATIYSPSEKLRSILFHINNALQLGIDVTRPLESVLDEITKSEELEIQKYGKKLNTLVIFYMLAAVIVPSLGVAMFIVISSFINFPIDLKGLMLIVFFIVVIQFIFITMFKSIRPMVNL
jgi:pilus assembly protein TadC